MVVISYEVQPYYTGSSLYKRGYHLSSLGLATVLRFRSTDRS